MTDFSQFNLPPNVEDPTVALRQTLASSFMSPDQRIKLANGTVSRLGDVLRGDTGIFGGDGSDGQLKVTSGTTTIDLGAASVYVAQYSYIEISGTGSVTFTNPGSNGTFIIFKSKGDVILTSSATRLIDARGMGAAGGAAVAVSTAGNPGNNGTAILDAGTHYGSGGANGTPSSGGAAGAIYDTKTIYTITAGSLIGRGAVIATGSGGGSGAGGDGAGAIGGKGGDGGGALLIECGGALNFTGTIDASGTAGSNGGAGTGNGSGGGGGGGAHGMAVIRYRSLTANSGTITAAGGAGGTGGSQNGGAGNAGSGGGGAGGYFAGGAGGAVDGGGGPNAGANAAGIGGGGGGGSGRSTGAGAGGAGGTGGGSISGAVAQVI